MTRSKAVADPIWQELAAQIASSGRTVRHQGVAEEIAGQIENLILDRTLADGSRLPSERDLADIFSTSRPTISQAIRILVVRGVVDSRRGSGAYVTTRPAASGAVNQMLMRPNHDSIGDLHEFRLWLETKGVQEAISNGTSKELGLALGALNRMGAHHGDIAEWISADTQFHAALVRASQNQYLAAVYETVHSTLLNYEYRSWIESGRVPSWLAGDRLTEVVELHAPILDAILARDSEGVINAVAHHHQAMAQHLLASSEERPG
ncbi:MAG: FadR/GntR family transcriptional regulator [Actinomycetota bacterium]